MLAGPQPNAVNMLARSLAWLKTQPPAPMIHDKDEIARRYRYWRLRVMYSTTVGYAVFYLVRNNMSMATKSITDEFHFTNTQWGRVLGLATIVYAFSKFLSGVVGDRANPRYLLGLALLFSAIINIAFGFGTSLLFFSVLWALNSAFQGVGVPPCTRLLTFWYSPREIGRAWGVWNASHQVGGAVIALWAGYLVTHHGWRSAFWVPAVVGVAGALWLMNRLRDSPESMGLPPIEVYKERVARPADSPAVPFGQIFRQHILANPWVWLVSVANFFVYVVRIGILSWAPKYLVEAKGFTLVQAGFSLSAFEVAGIFGAYASGWLSDTVLRGRRGPVSTGFMLCLIAFTFALFAVPNGHVATMTALFSAIGFFVYGPQMLVAVAAADYATKVASASAVGLTGLFGYLGASFCGLATGMLVDRYGWNAALWLYAGSAVIGCALLALTWNKASPLLDVRT
jgi:phosphoglycerate transporter family protein